MNTYFPKEDTQMTSTHLKRYSTTLTNREMLVKTTIRYHFITTRMVKFKRTKNNKCCQRCGKLEHLYIADGNIKMAQLLWITVWQFFKWLNIEFPYDPTVGLLNIYFTQKLVKEYLCQHYS